MLLYTSGGVDALVAVAVAVALGLPNNLFSPIIAVFILFSFLFFFFWKKGSIFHYNLFLCLICNRKITYRMELGNRSFKFMNKSRAGRLDDDDTDINLDLN